MTTPEAVLFTGYVLQELLASLLCYLTWCCIKPIKPQVDCQETP